MKFIIFICNRLRQGQFPRLPAFPYNEKFGKYIYGGKEMDLAEFNEACDLIFDPNYRTSGYTFRPLAIDTAAIPAEPVPAPAPAYVVAIDPSSEETSEETAPSSEVIEEANIDNSPAPGFAQDGDDIYFEGRIVGRLFDGKLKMVKGEGELRDRALSFISSAETPTAETESLV